MIWGEFNTDSVTAVQFFFGFELDDAIGFFIGLGLLIVFMYSKSVKEVYQISKRDVLIPFIGAILISGLRMVFENLI